VKIRPCISLDAPALSEASKSRLDHIKDKTAELRRILESDEAQEVPNNKDDKLPACPWPSIIGDRVLPPNKDEAYLQLNKAATPHTYQQYHSAFNLLIEIYYVLAHFTRNAYGLRSVLSSISI
jgi:hypothetical protein